MVLNQNIRGRMMNNMAYEVQKLVEYYDIEEKLIDEFYSEELENYFIEADAGSNAEITRLIIENSSSETLDNILKVQEDFRTALDHLGSFWKTLEKYNRRLDNSCDDLWNIFEANTTQHPKEMLLSIILPVLLTMNLIDGDDCGGYL